MLRYYITERKSIGGTTSLLRNIERLGDGFDVVQIREKDLCARDLASLVRDVMRVVHPSAIVLVNDRADVAMACGAHGVHLPGNSIAASRVRAISPRLFKISVACHSVGDVQNASREMADYALLAPIFATPGKGAPIGIEALRAAAQVSSIAVLALGGIDATRIAECEVAGASGFAAIRYFQKSS